MVEWIYKRYTTEFTTAVLLVILMTTLLLSLFVGVGVPVALFIGILAGDALGMILVGHFRHRKADNKGLLGPDDIKPPKDVKFCSDCGRAYVPWKEQHGFSATTGEPNMRVTMACPQWDQKAAMADHEAMRRAMSFSLSFNEPVRTSCGKTVMTGVQRELHDGHPTKDVSQTCPGCIEDMVANGVVDRARANELLRFVS